MRGMNRFGKTGGAALVVGAALVSVAWAGSETSGAPPPQARQAAEAASPVIKLKNRSFGYILATRKKLPLYYWNREKNAGGKIRCTGQCAVVWPPVVLPRGQSMPRRIAGVKGTFGTITRPDGRRQVTHKGLPLYWYHNDPPNTVLCDNVDGWFVVRV